MNKKLDYLQVYSGIAILFVVLIHANGYYLHNILGLNLAVEAGNIFYLVDNFLQVAVSMFIFIAGYKYEMTKGNKSIKQFYYDKIKKNGKPFVLISLFFIISILILSILKKVILNQYVDIVFYAKIFVLRFIKIFIGYNEVYQLWYIPLYMLIVLIYPMICRLIKSSKTRFIFFISIAILQAVSSLQYEWLNIHPFDFTYYFYLFELGVIFFNYRKCRGQVSNKIFILYFITLFLSYIFKQKILSLLFNQFLLWPIGCIIFYKISLMFREFKLLKYIGKYSFYIFLFHEPIYMKSIGMFINKLGLYNSWIPIPLISIGGIVLSILTYKIFMKFRIGRYILNISYER